AAASSPSLAESPVRSTTNGAMACIPACLLAAGLWHFGLPPHQPADWRALGMAGLLQRAAAAVVAAAPLWLRLGFGGVRSDAPVVLRGTRPSMYRPAADDGLVWGALLVLLVLLSRSIAGRGSGGGPAAGLGHQGAWVLGMGMSWTFSLLALDARMRQGGVRGRTGVLALALAGAVYVGIAGSPALGGGPTVGALAVLAAASAQHTATVVILRSMPRSFTLGEAAVAAQGAVLGAADLAVRVVARVRAGPGDAGDAHMPGLLLEVAVLALVLLVCVLAWIHPARGGARGAGVRAIGTVRFCFLTGAFACGALCLAAFISGVNPLAWACGALLGRPAHWAVLAYWAVLLAGGAALYTAVPVDLAAAGHAKLVLHIKRKAYHVLAVLLFAPAHIAAPVLLHVGFTAALAAFVVAEAARTLGVGPWAAAIDRFLRRFTDARDAGQVVTSHFYLLLGCALPVWLGGARAACLAGVLALGVADTAASLVGLRLGRHRWPGSPKTIEGTAGFVLGLFAAASLVPAGGGPGPAARLALCAMLGLLEALTEQNDNLVVALTAHAAMNALAQPGQRAGA
ncbi:dolichol kinase, partial [Coemansia biformis]